MARYKPAVHQLHVYILDKQSVTYKANIESKEVIKTEHTQLPLNMLLQMSFMEKQQRQLNMKIFI